MSTLIVKPAPTLKLDHLHPVLFSILMFVVFFLVGLSIASESLDNYWFSDDLFLFRIWDTQELIAAFYGPMENSGVSTVTYRPLTPLFYHLQYLAFGEHFALYRLFNIALLALDLVILGWIAYMLRMTRWQILLAGVLILAMRNTWFTLIWLTFAIRQFQLFFVFSAALLFLRFLKDQHPLQLLLGALYFAVAVFIREEFLPFVVIIPFMGLLYLWQNSPEKHIKAFLRHPQLKQVILIALLLSFVTAAYWLLRLQVVPNAVDASAQGPIGWLVLLSYILFPRMPFVHIGIAIALMALMWLLLAWMFRKVPASERVLAVFWLICALLSGSVGMGKLRPDLSFLGIVFFSLFLSTLLVGYGRCSYRAALVAGIFTVVLFTGSAVANKTAQHSIHPENVYTVYINLYEIWVNNQFKPIPEFRRQFFIDEYRRWGITSDDYAPLMEAWLQDARAAGRHLPNHAGLLFDAYHLWHDPR